MSTNEELAIASPVSDKQLIDDSSSVAKVNIKYGDKNYEKSEDHTDLDEDGRGIPLSVFNTLIDSVIKLDPDAEPNVSKGNIEQMVQGLTSPDHIPDFHPNIDYDVMIKSGEVPICPEKIEDKPESERPVTRNSFRSESQSSEGPVLNIKGKPSYFRLNLDVNEEFLSELSASHVSSGEEENFTTEEKHDMIEAKKSHHKDDSQDKTPSVSQSESDLSEKNDYMNMINQEIYSIVNAISPVNLKAIEISEENILPPVLESDIKPIVIEDSDAHCIFGWSLLSPGVMEIKINPESDDSNDIIRVRRTSSLQCHIESGDITKLNILKENENTENGNDNGDMDYVDFIEYLAQASNRIQDDKTIIKEARVNSTEQEVKNILQEATEKVDQQIKEDEDLLLTEVKSIKEKFDEEKENTPEHDNILLTEVKSIKEKTPENEDILLTEVKSIKEKEKTPEDEDILLTEVKSIKEKEKTPEDEDILLTEVKSIKEKEKTPEDEHILLTEVKSIKEKEKTPEDEDILLNEVKSIKEKEKTPEDEHILLTEVKSIKEKEKTPEDEDILVTEIKSIKEKEKTPEDVKFVQLESEMILPEEETLIVQEERLVENEKSLVSLKIVESNEHVVTKTHSVDTHKVKKGKKIFSPVKKWFKSKKSEPLQDSSKKQNEGKKNKSWFRFWL